MNLETTLTTATEKAEKLFRFRGKPEYAQILKAGSVECVSVANNHTFDYLARGFDDTLASLKTAGVDYFGMDLECIREVRGIRVGLLGFIGFTTGVEVEVAKRIAHMKSDGGCSIVVATFHWGDEGSYTPNATQIYLAHKAIDAGADLVLGHHPHVIQGIEHYKNRSIAYSLGNFCYGGHLNPPDKACIVFQIRFTCIEGLIADQQSTIIPCRVSSTNAFNDFKPTPLEGSQASQVLQRLDSYSALIGKKPAPASNAPKPAQ